MIDWNSELYLKFERERAQAARDLLARIPPLAPRKIVDLGCGPGNSAALLSLYFRGGDILGIDTLGKHAGGGAGTAAGRAFRPAGPGRLDAGGAGRPDLRQRRPAFRARITTGLLPKLMSFLTPGGVLAVQMPNVLQDAAHALMRMVAVDGPWADKLAPVAKIPRHHRHARRLLRLALADRAQCRSLADHLRPSARRSGRDCRLVRRFGAAALPRQARRGERPGFLAQYRRELEMAYLPQADGKVLLLYPRLFFVAQR